MQNRPAPGCCRYCSGCLVFERINGYPTACEVVGAICCYGTGLLELTKGSVGYFAISGNNLMTAWSSPVAPGYYSVRVRAMGNNTPFRGSATCAINVAMAAPPPPPPPPPLPPPPPTPAVPVIAMTPSNLTIPDTTPLGAVVASFTVTMSDGSPFTGTVRLGAPDNDAGGVFAISAMSAWLLQLLQQLLGI